MSFKSPFPPLSEQTAIANFLDDKTAKIDQAIAIKRKRNYPAERAQTNPYPKSCYQRFGCHRTDETQRCGLDWGNTSALGLYQTEILR